MTEQEHREIMTNIMKELDNTNLNLGDGLSIWHSLGTFLFSNLDKEKMDSKTIYANMHEYLSEMQNANNNTK